MKKYILTQEQFETFLQYAHSYGRSQQFNYGLFGPDCEQAKPFDENKAIEYCVGLAEKDGLYTTIEN